MTRLEIPSDERLAVVAPVRGGSGTPRRPAKPAHARRGRRLSRLELVCSLGLILVLGGIALMTLGSATRDGQIAACSASTREVNIAIGALEAENTGSLPNSEIGWQHALLPGSTYLGAPFLNAWPGSRAYTIIVARTHDAIDSGDGIVPHSGDVLVVVRATGRAYDATRNPQGACTSV